MGEISQMVRELFDRKAAPWAQAYEPGGKFTRRSKLFVDKLMRFRLPPARLLDFGCGTGHIAKAFADRGYTAHGCDMSSAMLAEGQRLFGGPVELSLLPLDWSQLPYKDAFFDVAVASSVLEYVEDPDFVLRELARVIKPGGLLMLTVPNMRHPRRWLEWVLAQGLRIRPFLAIVDRFPRLHLHARFLRTSKTRFSEEVWVTRFTSAGFTVRETGPATSPALQLFALEHRAG